MCRWRTEKAFPYCGIDRMAVPDAPYRGMKRAFPQGEKARSAAQESRSQTARRCKTLCDKALRKVRENRVFAPGGGTADKYAPHSELP